jgi:hypothetical protein
MKRLLPLAFLVILPLVARGNEDLSKYAGTYKGEAQSFRDRTMTFTLTLDPVGKQAAPPPMTFRLAHKTLTPVSWNHNLWRTAPPPAMKRMKIKKRDPDDDL